jgi:hypothetical protein
MITKLSVLWAAIIAKMRAAPQPEVTATIGLTPNRCERNPGKRRPRKPAAFMITS